jgi:hypothetical protein
MALIFPNNPSFNQTYQSGSSATYQWNGNFWQVSAPGISSITIMTASYSERVANIQATPPTTGTGSFWYDIDTGNSYIKYNTTWVPVQSNTINATSASFALTASLARTASVATAISTSISNQNQQHNVLFVDTSGPGNIQIDGGLRYNPNTDLLTTTSSFAVSASQAVSASFATTASTTTLAYAAIGISSIPTFQNADMTPVLSAGSGGITVSGNTIIIARPGVYLLNASIGIRATYAEYGWADASNIQLQGTNLGMGVSANSADTASPANAMGIVNITSPNTIIKLRIFVAAGFNVQSGAYAGATITQLR